MSDDEDVSHGGQLDKMGTEMHFGREAFDRANVTVSNPYGPSDGTGIKEKTSMVEAHRSRENDLNIMPRRRKIEKVKKREEERILLLLPLESHFYL
mmetsp:Transcript_20248/g.19485  ORF Transcript_20248/g.19485 Transcript_20248/m.19485 type:complete len:96 (+) Transcript_20248:294-581(+)|eukprot:CAMPEP_0197840862 /NCGR_PEP_ID=MMETSP1437-20131217/45848_1 /TAXON_ID=49252 ORGANISM="Eucampia antarctica, Strain CCMP1452" /NCGR_SAMPLE_ID=MMETSP1437 /ASSEMBLY_ACC=CAM_ASM_001096 /LENGTH=95 /DNA_ID=CAMNT_0043450533 /DNA_START=197 /DNA_END=484 /DNA_ORIENTATION=-